MKKYYYLDKKNQVEGPFSVDEIKSLYDYGKITASTQICEEGKDNWKPYHLFYSDKAQPSATKLQKVIKLKGAQSKGEIQQVEQARDPVQNEPEEQKFEGVTKWQGAIIIFLLLGGLGSPMLSWVMPTQKWEYRIESPSDGRFQESMDKYGSEGWELVYSRRARDESGEMNYECIFKRKK